MPTAKRMRAGVTPRSESTRVVRWTSSCQPHWTTWRTDLGADIDCRAWRSSSIAVRTGPRSRSWRGAYTIWFSPERSRWYLDASWSTVSSPPGAREEAVANGVLAVDFNADHLACWIVNAEGNPTGKPFRVPLDLTGSSLRRDAQIRHAVSRLVRTCRSANVGAIAIENLGFDDTTTSRELHGRKRRFRHLLSTFPTTTFRRWLVVMSARAGLAVVAVDPAYTSKWGQQHWHRFSCPATVRCDRSEPEGCGEESYRPGSAGQPGPSGNPPAQRRTGGAVAQKT